MPAKETKTWRRKKTNRSLVAIFFPGGGGRREKGQQQWSDNVGGQRAFLNAESPFRVGKERKRGGFCLTTRGADGKDFRKRGRLKFGGRGRGKVYLTENKG